MDKEEFENRFGCLEEYVLTYDPFMGPQVTDLQNGANFIISEKDFYEVLDFFKLHFSKK